MNKKQKISVALIGFGMWGKNLARNFNTLRALKLIGDTSPSLLAEARKTYPQIDVSGSVDEILSRKDIQGIVIATPPATHKELALRALAAGKDIFVEKPLALSVADGFEIVQCVDRLQKILLVGHVLEYHPAVLKLQSLIKEGALGKLRYFYSHRLNFGRIRTEENSLWSFAPHDIAVMLRLLGMAPERVSCLGGNYLNPDLADTTMTNLEFKNGVQGHIFVSWLHPFKVHRMVLIGEKQMAVFDDTQPWPKKLTLFPHRVDWVNGQIPVARQAEGTGVALDENEPLATECVQFLDCIQTRRQPLTDGKRAVQVLQILEAAQHSISKHGAVIDCNSFFYPGIADSQPAEGKAVFIHPSAVVASGARVGKGTKIWHFAHVMDGATIGQGCTLGQNTFVGKNVVLGNHVKVQNNVSLYEGVTLEDAVFCGPSVVFTNVINPRSEVDRKKEFKPTLIQKGATLGANATILCGVTIGDYAFVAAGAVVTRDVPAYALVMGIPSKISGWMCRCGNRLKLAKKKAGCSACKRQYQWSLRDQLQEVP